MAGSRNRTMFSHFSTLLPIIISSGLWWWTLLLDYEYWQERLAELCVRDISEENQSPEGDVWHMSYIFHYSSYLPQTFSQALLTALKTEKIRMYEAEKESSCWWILERHGDGLSSCQKTSYSMRVMDVVTWQHAGYDKHRHVQDKPEHVGFFWSVSRQ